MKRLLAIIVSLALLISPALAGSIPLLGAGVTSSGGGGGTVGFVASNTSQNSFAARTSFSNAINFTTTSGANNLLLCALHFSGDPGAFSSVTYNSVAMTQFGTTQVATEALAYFYMMNPPAGDLTLAATYTNSVGPGWICAEFSGVNATTPLFNAVPGSGTSATPAITITGVAAGDGSFAGNTNGGANNSTATQTLIVTAVMTNGAGLQDSYSLNTGSVAYSWSNFNSVTWVGEAIEIKHD